MSSLVHDSVVLTDCVWMSIKRHGALLVVCCFLFFQAEDGIRDLVRSRGLGDVYKRQAMSDWGLSTYRRWCRWSVGLPARRRRKTWSELPSRLPLSRSHARCGICLLYTSDAADERSSVDLGGRRIIKKKKKEQARRL